MIEWKTIPAKYRERLYGWEGGGFDGCLWMLNFGYVDRNCHWKPVLSNGYNGLDAGRWLDEKIKDACKAGDQAGVARLGAERIKQNDDLFMQVMEGVIKRDRWTDFGSLGPEDIKRTCKEFCDAHAGNQAMVVRCLNELHDDGYAPWATCTDCGEQFQLESCSFSEYLDMNAYLGDGGVGVRLTRLLCPRCLDAAQCHLCHNLRVPNHRAGETAESLGYSVFDRLLFDWAGICDVCADEFRDTLPEDVDEKVDDAVDDIETGLGSVETTGGSIVEAAVKAGLMVELEKFEELLEERLDEWLDERGAILYNLVREPRK